MVYINADGTVKEERSKVRLSLISDIFWTIFDVVGIFIQTLINPSYRPPSRPKLTQKPKSKGPNIKGLKPQGEMNCAAGG
mmetsp:Transcript_15349/g.33593  ORF Transcript_15349/g.33593 Transcript_15349/m.33593 type:complete len:80 (+) Transcript_15349:81-320(+)